MLAFAANAWVSPVPDVVRLGLVLAALVLAWALYHWVEDPLRRANIAFSRKSLLTVLTASIMLVLTSFAVNIFASLSGQKDFTQVRRGNLGLNTTCEFDQKFESKSDCRNSDVPKILIWGDSYAMHLVDGIAASTNLGLMQATKTTCGPMVGISKFDTTGYYNRQWAEGCIRFNQSVLDYISKTQSIEVVVFSSFYGQYLDGNSLLSSESNLAKDAQSHVYEISGSSDVALKSLQSSINAVRAMGKRVVLVAPPPSSGFNIGQCLELKANGKAVIGADAPTCTISMVRYRAARAPVLAFLDRVAQESNVTIVRLDDFLCRAGSCMVELNGTFLYRDEGHLSHDGSRLIGLEMGLANRLLSAAY